MNIKNLFNKFNRTFLNLKWTCNACGKEIFEDKYFCQDCKEKLIKISSEHCDHCGRRTENATLFCESCAGKNVNFDLARSTYAYNETISKVILKYKYSAKTYLSDIFAKDLCDIYMSNFLVSDYLTYIPMTREREKIRGYNQSKILADKMSKILNVPVELFIDKVVETQRQATLSQKDRLENLKGSFKKKNINLTNKVITIVDDVLTTGVTTDLMAKILKDMGAAKVYVLTIASVGKNIKEL